MMLRAPHANDVVPSAQIKNPKAEAFGFLAGAGGFEPTTLGFGDQYSTS